MLLSFPLFLCLVLPLLSSFILESSTPPPPRAPPPSSSTPKKKLFFFISRKCLLFSQKRQGEAKRRAEGGGGWLLPLSLSASILAQLASQPLSLLFPLLCSPSPLLSFSSRSLINLIFRSFFPEKFSYCRTAAVRPCPGGPFVIIAQEEAVPHSRTFIYEEKKKRIPFARGHLRRLPLKSPVDYDAKRQFQNHFVGKPATQILSFLALVCVGDPAALPKIKLELLRQKMKVGKRWRLGWAAWG